MRGPVNGPCPTLEAQGPPHPRSLGMGSRPYTPVRS